MLLKYSRLLIWTAVCGVLLLVYYSGELVAKSSHTESSPVHPQYLESVKNELSDLYIYHYDFVRGFVDENINKIRTNACVSNFDGNSVEPLSNKAAYKSHLKWINHEFDRLESILKVIAPPHTKETFGDPPLTHENSDLVDNSPEVQSYRQYVSSMEQNIKDRTLVAPGGASEGSVVLLTAAHNPSSELITARDEWARIHRQKHVVVNLDKYSLDRSPLDIGVTANWLYIAAIEEIIHRYNSDWIWYLHPDFELKDKQQDILNILNHLEFYELGKFPLQSSHRDLKGGVLAPKVSSSDASFVVSSNNIALDLSSMFIRNQESTLRYLQYWCAKLNLVDNGAFWNLDDQFDNRSEEAFAHMYRVYDFIRKITAVIPQNAIPHGRA